MKLVQPFSLFTEFDIDLFKAGKHYRLYEKLGSHIVEHNGVNGVYFAVWAPMAEKVSVIGDFNNWQETEHLLNVRWDSSGIWEGFIPEVVQGALYKYKIHSKLPGIITEKADPFAKFCQLPPDTASVVWDLNYTWKDKKWMSSRKKNNALDKPFSVYEVHLASWKRNLEEDRFLSYEELAEELIPYVKNMGFTHVELMPVMEYPYDPSWGYQLTGYYAPTSRFGNPEGFMYLVDKFHQAGIGVLLDWVVSHFPYDLHGLGFFDGSCVYEHPDKRKGFHPDWKSFVFNYGRNEVRAYLISNALFWLDKYHADGFRVDAVASMIHLDYSRGEGEWESNQFGGRENLEAISFLKEFNEAVYNNYPDVQTIAEDSTAHPNVSRPTYDGGLGFGMKWMMGWMHDTLDYFKRDTVYRSYHQNEITFSLVYAFNENYMLPLSHDEVVHGKSSIWGRMPGDEWRRFANLRALYSYMFVHPGTKLLFMGNEFGQSKEWDFKGSLEWYLLQYKVHSGLQLCIQDLNKLYTQNPELYEKQFSAEGFEWINGGDTSNSVLTFIRKGKSKKSRLVIVCNFSPNAIEKYRVGMPSKGKLVQIFNSDDSKYGGSGVVMEEPIKIEKTPWDYREFSAEIRLAPLAVSVFKIL